ncbi:hypothetical protein V6N11_017088 [Hibiscus sabdariffa]|uniref:Uncharacterized protein n=1 Tax=Hibiscus sabdariffa TaxID=183260 RepID=A0ABR2TXC5_9ROSI
MPRDTIVVDLDSKDRNKLRSRYKFETAPGILGKQEQKMLRDEAERRMGRMGIGPCKLLERTFSTTKCLLELLRHNGILPLKSFCEMSRIERELTLHNSCGISPLRELLNLSLDINGNLVE